MYKDEALELSICNTNRKKISMFHLFCFSLVIVEKIVELLSIMLTDVYM